MQDESNGQSGFLTRFEAATEAGVKPGTIDKWLREPGGPPWHKFRRQVRIPRKPFIAWLESQVREGGQ